MLKFSKFFLLSEEKFDSYAITENYIDLVDSNEYNMLTDYIDGVRPVKWKVVKAPRLIKIWKDFSKMGIIRDEKGLNDIRNTIINNIARLKASNNLQGHLAYGDRPKDILEKYGLENQIELVGDGTYLEFPEDFYYEYFSGDDSGYISDYGFPKLEDLITDLYTNEDEELLYTIDKALNIIHQRSDLSTLFIEGGEKTLNEIFEYTGKD